MSNHFLHKSNYQRPFQQIQKDTNTRYHRNKRCPTNSATNLIIKEISKEETNCGPKTLFSVSANFSNFWLKISRCRHKQGSTNCGILHPRIGEHVLKFGEHENDEKHQPDEWKHSIYDSKHTIYDSKHSICQPVDSKHTFLQHFCKMTIVNL